MSRSRGKLIAGIYMSPDGVRWLHAAGAGDSLRITGGGHLPPENDDFPPPVSTLLPLLKRRIDWNFVVPFAVRTALVELPPLDVEKLVNGAHWEARKRFRSMQGASVYDFELLPQAVATEELTHHNAMLIALSQEAVNAWLQWLSVLPGSPARLEPMFAACLRSLRYSCLPILHLFQQKRPDKFHCKYYKN